NAQSPGGPLLDGSPMPLGSTATHEPTPITHEVWARWKSLGTTPRDKRNSELSGLIEGYLADCGDLTRKRS
ncbi:MAG: hypothetical protein RXN84_02435, partial [Caldivirga sp.]